MKGGKYMYPYSTLSANYPPDQCPVCWEEDALEGGCKYDVQEGKEVIWEEDFECSSCGFTAYFERRGSHAKIEFTFPDPAITKGNVIHYQKLFGLFACQELLP